MAASSTGTKKPRFFSSLYRSPKWRGFYTLILAILIGIFGSRVAFALDARGQASVWDALTHSWSFLFLVIIIIFHLIYWRGDYEDHEQLMLHADDEYCIALLRAGSADTLVEQLRNAIATGKKSGAMSVEDAMKTWDIFK